MQKLGREMTLSFPGVKQRQAEDVDLVDLEGKGSTEYLSYLDFLCNDLYLFANLVLHFLLLHEYKKAQH